MTGRVVVITGAAGGIGQVMALALLDAGARVVAADLPAADHGIAELLLAVQARSATDRLLVVPVDITSYEQCCTLVDRARAAFGQINVLVNNAALSHGSFTDQPVSAPPKFTEVPIEKWRALVDVNVNGTFHMTRAVVPDLIAQGWGRIVTIVTSLTTMAGKGFSPYGASKAFLEAATRSWAEDLEGTGVTVNALLPGGITDTPFVPATDPRDRSSFLNPSVMAAPIVWLASSASDGVTGQRFIGKDWNPEDDDAQNVARAGAPAGWRPSSFATRQMQDIRLAN